MNITQAQLNHLRRLIGWVRCEIGPAPEEMIPLVRAIAGTIGDPGTEGKAAFVQWHAESSNVPRYVRDAVVALEKLITQQDGAPFVETDAQIAIEAPRRLKNGA